jgi:branched-chain amino acid transport system substrate-binding protein
VTDETWIREYQQVEYRNPDTYSINGHSAMAVLAAGVTKAGTFDATSVSNAIRGLGGIETTMGDLAYQNDGDLQDQKIYIYQVQEGDWVQVYP